MDDRPTANPTTEAIWRLFDKARLTRIVVGGRVVHRMLHGLDEHAHKVLSLLGWPAHVFTTPPRNSAEDGLG